MLLRRITLELTGNGAPGAAVAVTASAVTNTAGAGCSDLLGDISTSAN
jgi:hypothetical protein